MSLALMKTNNFPSHTGYSGIHLFNELELALPLSKDDFESLASCIAEEENCSFYLLEIVFVDRQTIIAVNKEHLEHDYITDIISFRYDRDSTDQAIEGTLYCCGPRILEQAKELGQSPEREFKRIVTHGLLHLAGYNDKTESQKKVMRAREDYYLDKLNKSR